MPGCPYACWFMHETIGHRIKMIKCCLLSKPHIYERMFIFEKRWISCECLIFCKCNFRRNQRMNHDFLNCYVIDVDIQKCLDTHFIYYTNDVLMNLLYVKLLAIQKSILYYTNDVLMNLHYVKLLAIQKYFFSWL